MTVAEVDNGWRRRDAGWEERALDRSLQGARARATAQARRLVEAARELALASGNSHFTVAEVARRAGLSVKTFYRHFAGKDELLLALFEDDSRRGVEVLTGVAASIADPTARLRALVVTLFGFSTDAPDYAAMLVREHLRLAAEYPIELNHSLEPLVGLLSEEIESAARAGAIRPADRRDAVIVLNLVLAHLHALVLGQLDEQPVEIAERLWRFCWAALLPFDGDRIGRNVTEDP